MINHANRFVKAAFQLWDTTATLSGSLRLVCCATDLYYR